ncbi:MAG: alpha/beta hydrolase family protein [Hyphomicrobiaceae bacterium]
MPDYGVVGGERVKQVAISVIGAMCSAALFALASGASAAAEKSKPDNSAVTRFGPFGPMGPRMCEQLWMLPGASDEIDLRATVFRPGASCSDKARPLVVINHGTDASTNESVSMPVFYWLSRWFVSRGWAVVLPQRRGHGATGGELVEGRDTCARPEHFASAQAAADDIEAAVRYMAHQTFVLPDTIVVAGISSGGWASLALSGRDIPGLRGVVNFAGGRGGHAGGRANAICGRKRLVSDAGRLGSASRVPSLWLYAQNDSYFSPRLATTMFRAFVSAGARARLQITPAYGREGHYLANDQAGWSLWSEKLAAFLSDIKENKGDHYAVGMRKPPVSPAGYEGSFTAQQSN